MDRRKALQLFGTAGAVAAAGSILATSCNSAAKPAEVELAPAAAANSSSPSGTPPYGGPGIETKTGGAIYDLPRDHALHGGAYYKRSEYQESQYFTAMGVDKKTGDPFSLFFCPTLYGYDAKIDRPFWVGLFAVTDIKRRKFVQCVHAHPGTLTTQGSGPDVAKDAFWFDYLLDGSKTDGSSIRLSHRSKDETWRWVGNVPRPNTKVANYAYSLDVTGKVMAPGYMCPSPTGVTLEGSPTDGPDRMLANPLTGLGISHYVVIPNMAMTGTVKVDDIDIDFDGVAWAEHQWGIYRTPLMEQGKYFWGYCRMDDGIIITWRSFYDKSTRKIVNGLNRFMAIWPDGRFQYWGGADYSFDSTKTWKSLATGQDISLWGVLKTPIGTFFLEPLTENQEAQTINKAGLWEGVVIFRAGSAQGPIVGRAFVEHGWGPPTLAPVAESNGYDAELPRKPEGGAPVLDNPKRFLNWK